MTGFNDLDAAGVRSAVGLGSANLDTQLAAIDDYVDTEVAAIKTVTDKLDTAMELDGAVYRFTTNALEQAPTGGSAPTAAQIADAVWDEARADHTTTGTFGQGMASVQGNVTGSVGSVTGNVGGNVVGSVASVTAGVTVTTNNDKTGYAIGTGGIGAAAFAAGAIDSAAIATDAIGAAELASDAASEIATAVLSAATSTPIQSDVRRINNTALTGNGSTTPWGPA